MPRTREPRAPEDRIRRTATYSRAACAVLGLITVAAVPSLHPHPAVAALGFAVLLITAAVNARPAGERTLRLDEAVGAVASCLILGTSEQQVTVLALLWLCAVIAGLLARGGRLHWAGRAIVLGGLLLPIVLELRLEPSYAALFAGCVCMLLCAGRMTAELTGLLAEARFVADHDGLTGALSRTAFREALDRAARTGPVTALVIDLDGFGQINKAQGHAAGDRMLAAAAGRLRDVLPEGHALGRLGGDEFAVAVPDGCPEALGRGVLTALGTASDNLHGIGASVGIAYAPRHGRDAETLLRAADIAQRLAKRSGKGNAVTYDGHALDRPGPTGALGALSRLIDGQGLQMATQPIFDVRTGTVHAYEALARFATRTTSSPLHWLTLAEEFGLRADLELACLRAGVALLPDRPAGCALSVNLSARLLDDPRVFELLDRYERHLDGLIIEVTEDSLVGGSAAAVPAIVERGVRLAVDDMGAGYSGLRQLTLLQPDYLKLDRLLVRDIDRAPDRVALLEALVGYARRTGSAIVAEGVERQEELDALRALGVPFVQGFLLGHPAPPFPLADAAAVALRA